MKFGFTAYPLLGTSCFDFGNGITRFLFVEYTGYGIEELGCLDFPCFPRALPVELKGIAV